MTDKARKERKQIDIAMAVAAAGMREGRRGRTTQTTPAIIDHRPREHSALRMGKNGKIMP